MNQQQIPADAFEALREGLTNGSIRATVIITLTAEGQVSLTSLGALQPIEALGVLSLSEGMVLQQMRAGEGERSRIARIQ